MIKKILLAVAVLVVGFVAVVASRSSTYAVERSSTMEAPAAIAHEIVNDFRRWSEFSPWEKLDPQMQTSREGADAGVGSIYSWSGNEKVGKGKMTISESVSGEKIVIALEFLEPWESKNTATFTFAEAEGKTTVSWRTEGEMGFVAKAAGLFMNMDEMLGSDLQAGLDSLKTIAEAEAKKRAEEEAKRQAEAAVAAAEGEADAGAAGEAEADADAELAEEAGEEAAE